MTYRHLSRDYKVEQKVFILEVEDKSFGERILLTERTRYRGYQISFDLGCAAWLIDQLKEAVVTNGQIFFRKYRGHNYQFWVERFHNKNGDFLVLSKSEKDGFVRNIFVPKGSNFFGWRSLEDLLSEILRGGKRAGASQMNVKRDGIEPMSSHSGFGPQVSYRDAVLGGKRLTNGASLRNVREESWIKKNWNMRDTSTESYSWGSVIVCERLVVHQPWRVVEASLQILLGKKIWLSPFQCNKALFVCQNEEEATKIAQLGVLAMNKLPDVVLSGWWDSIKSNDRKVVSYGGWVALEGLPPHLWTNDFFQKIGDACGGLVEVDRRTANFGFLIEAKLKIKTNNIGFIPEFVNVVDGESVFRVKLRQLSPAKRPKPSAADGGVTTISNGSLKTESKLQRITGIIPPAKADFQQTEPISGTRVCFQIGDFECPVNVGSERKQGESMHVTESVRVEKPVTNDSTFSVRKQGEQQRVGKIIGAVEMTEAVVFSEGAEKAVAGDYFNNSIEKGSQKEVVFSDVGKGLEVCGTDGGGGWLTRGSSTSMYSTVNNSQVSSAMKAHHKGVSSKTPMCFNLNFLGRFGDSDICGKRLKLVLPDEFGSYLTPFERPKLKEIQSPNLTFLINDSEQMDEKESDVDDVPIRPSGRLIEEESSEQRMRLTEDLGLDYSQLSDFGEDEYMSQSSVSEEEFGDSSQDEKETFDVFDRFNDVFHNLFTDTTMETRTTLDEVPSQSHHIANLDTVEQVEYKDTGKNKKLLKYSRRKRSARVSVKREAQTRTTKFMSNMKVSLVPLKRSLFLERNTGKVIASKPVGGNKAEKKIQGGIVRFNEDN